MDFQDFVNISSKLSKITLPGEEAHLKLAPMFRLEELKKPDFQQKKPKHAAVLAVFYPDAKSRTNFVLILRKTYKGVHSNQVGFPGGRFEKEDPDLEFTALRETEEEVGIAREDVQVLKQLTRLYIPPSNFWVQPFIGMMHRTPLLIPQEEEVESVLEIDLDDFLSDSCLTKQTLNTSYAKEIEVPAFLLNGHVVWGATAMMLSEMKEILRQTL